MASGKLTDINSAVAPMKCSNCEKKFGKTYGWLKAYAHLICDCVTRTDWSPEELVDVVKRVTETRAKAIEKFRQILKR